MLTLVTGAMLDTFNKKRKQSCFPTKEEKTLIGDMSMNLTHFALSVCPRCKSVLDQICSKKVTFKSEFSFFSLGK